MKLVSKKDTTDNITLNNNTTKVTSLRINEEFYNIVKDRAVKENKRHKMQNLISLALKEFLDKYK